MTAANMPDGPTFAAQYTGFCRDCDTAWKPGDPIRYTSRYGYRTAVHGNCDFAAIEPLEGAVCPKCFMRRALSGECGCDS